MNKGKIPLAEYEKIAAEFNPIKFDARALVHLAKEAGMKYMVITSKHHDGFSMFHSHSNPFNIVDATPFKRDVLKELADPTCTFRTELGESGLSVKLTGEAHDPTASVVVLELADMPVDVRRPALGKNEVGVIDPPAKWHEVNLRNLRLTPQGSIP